MRIDRTEFVEITIDGKTYEHDVIIRLSGEVVKRKRSCQSGCMVPRTSCRKTRRNSCSKRGANSSSSARAKRAMCTSLRRQRLTLPRRIARS